MNPPIRGLALIAVAAAALGSSTAGCATVQRATAEQLQYRATFDLGCPGGQLWLYHIDSRTKAVAGCGQRLVYLEQCDALAGACSWTIDTPNALHAQGPRPVSKPAAAQHSSANHVTEKPRGRTIRTGLYGEDRARTAAKPPEPRQTPTELFGGPPGKTGAPPGAPPAAPPAAPPGAPPAAPSAPPSGPPSAAGPPDKGRPPGQTPPLPPDPATPPPPETPYDYGF